MIARRFEDLIVWQLSNELKEKVFAITDHPPASRDFRFCDQIRESSRSATRNTAEGFGRFSPKEFKHFLNIAAGSLHETRNHLRDGLDRKYIAREKYEELARLALRALKANLRLQQYLKSAPKF